MFYFCEKVSERDEAFYVKRQELIVVSTLFKKIEQIKRLTEVSLKLPEESEF